MGAIGVKTIVVTVATVCVIFYVIFRTFEDEWFDEGEKCNENEICVRFCCKNVTVCNDKSHFNLHENDKIAEKVVNLSKTFRPIKGICKTSFTEEEWEFLKVVNYFSINES